jgi:xanthine dehydrogenase YagS FAD-binding subunit
MLPSFSYIRSESLDQAISKLGDGARVHAGGTDLVGCLREHILPTASVVSISALDDLRGARMSADQMVVGALTTISEIAAHNEIRSRFTALSDAASVVASPQLRNQGTIGGNLCQKTRCWYYRNAEMECLRRGGERCSAFSGENQGHAIFGGEMCYMVHPSDTAPALVALDAAVRIAGPRGTRTIPVAELHVPASVDPQRDTYLEEGEIVTEVRIPMPPKGLKSSYRKVRSRATWDFALVGVALALAVDGKTVRHARVVLSGVAATPWRSKPAEATLTGATLNAGTIAAAAKAATKDADPLEHNAYKVPMLEGLVAEQLEKLAG